MGSDNAKLEQMRMFETILWPEIDKLEHVYRRSDALFIVSNAIGLAAITLASAFATRPWTGLLCGFGIAFGGGIGWALHAMRDRRREYCKLEALHVEAELELKLHDDAP